MSELRFAGVDWASEEHAVCVVDEHGRIVEGRRYRHNETGIRALCSRLVRLDVKLVALERPDGLLIERLLDAGLAVIAVHPNQVKASRPRYSVAGGKSDGFDSFVLAELARTDSHRFRVLVPDGDATKALRAMTRARESLVRTRVGLANQLRDQLATLLARARARCSEASTRRSRSRSCKRYPTPGRCPRARVSSAWRRFSSATAIRAANPPASCSQRLRGAARGSHRQLEMQARAADRARARLRPGADRGADQRADASRSATRSTRTRTDGRSARCSSARLVAVRRHACSPRSVTAAIATPPTANSPPTAARPRSRSSPAKPNAPSSAGRAITDCAPRSTRSPTQAAATTHGLRTSTTAPRARGASHAHASRILGRAWCQVIWRLWHDHDTYDPQQHTALQRVIAAAA